MKGDRRVCPEWMTRFFCWMSDKRHKREKIRDEIRERSPDHKTAYDRIKAGEQEPTGSQKGWKNLQPEKYNFAVMDQDKHREISRKGAAAVNKLYGEKKSARESLETILTLKVTPEIIAGADLPQELAERLQRTNPDATLYDLIQIVAAGRAVGGNMKAYELIRDTYGDKPHETVDVNANVTTDQDRELMRKIAERLDHAELIQVVDQDSHNV